VKEPKADCFYVYPTVDLRLGAYNHEDFTDTEMIADVTLAQAARFRESCALYVPLYRQISVGTYLRSGERIQQGLAVAEQDIQIAFAEYLASYNRGRPIVLLGHNQGAEMIKRLLLRFFDGDDARAAELRRKLLVAMPIGGIIEVETGKNVGGTFAHLPLCTRDDETGCVIAYRSYDAAEPVDPSRYAPDPGRTSACVDPVDVSGNTRKPFSRAYFPVLPKLKTTLHDVPEVTTPFVLFRDLYAGQCVEDGGGSRYRWLAISAETGRKNPIDFASAPLRKRLGLHVYDMQFAQGELLAHVARRVAAL
jgi:hypothetical protein